MLFLPASLNAWGSEDFIPTFKSEIANIEHQHLPLQKGLSLSSYVSDDKISPIVNRSHEDNTHILIDSGIFYYGIIAGCSCSDDPTPQDTQTEYCEIRFTINKLTAETQVILLPD